MFTGHCKLGAHLVLFGRRREHYTQNILYVKGHYLIWKKMEHLGQFTFIHFTFVYDVKCVIWNKQYTIYILFYMVQGTVYNFIYNRYMSCIRMIVSYVWSIYKIIIFTQNNIRLDKLIYKQYRIGIVLKQNDMYVNMLCWQVN